MTTITRIPELRCLRCLERLNATSTFHSDEIPAAGDFMMCLYCSHPMVFTDDLNVRELTVAEMIEWRLTNN